MIKGLVISVTSLFVMANSYANTKSICGPSDDRIPSQDPKIGRLAVEGQHKGCTVTMISETCGITAGHCGPVLVVAEFNTPESINDEPQASNPKDVYHIDQNTIELENGGPGQDWAVFKFKRNKITGKFPGQAQGYYNVSFNKLTSRKMVNITGYGRDEGDLKRNFAQQFNEGKITALSDPTYGDTVIKHTVDTMGGNSGSTIIDARTQEVVGIHTHGGCSSVYGYNMGTQLARHAQLKAAVKKCLASE